MLDLIVILLVPSGPQHYGPMACNLTFGGALPQLILGGYAIGYNPEAPPFTNTLTGAQAWCCNHASPGGDCKGVTHQNGTFQARAGDTPRYP